MGNKLSFIKLKLIVTGVRKTLIISYIKLTFFVKKISSSVHFLHSHLFAQSWK